MIEKFKKGEVYAIHHGDYAGQMLAVCKTCSPQHEDVHLLSFPEMHNIVIPRKEMESGIERGIVRFAERLPRSVRRVAIKQYEQNERAAKSKEN